MNARTHIRTYTQIQPNYSNRCSCISYITDTAPRTPFFYASGLVCRYNSIYNGTNTRYTPMLCRCTERIFEKKNFTQHSYSSVRYTPHIHIRINQPKYGEHTLNNCKYKTTHEINSHRWWNAKRRQIECKESE